MKWTAVRIASVLAGLVTLCSIMSSHVSADKVSQPCTDVSVVYARGSGQKLNDGEYARFHDEVLRRLKSPISINYYELGTESYGGSKYPAVTVGKWWENGNAIGAKLSAGNGNDYGKSVDAGVTELQNYLDQRIQKCPNERIVLGGYSQGAQVLGQTLPLLAPAIQSKIDFVALFGDPKLHLPEGEGIYPDACRGKNLSQWRRVIGDCHTDNGSLGARKPFLPSTLQGKVGLWCNAVDFVCGSSKMVYDQAGHGKYKDVGGAIDQAALEISKRVKIALPAEKADKVDADLHIALKNPEALDVVFMINTVRITEQRLDEFKSTVNSMAAQVEALHGRVALAEYGRLSLGTTMAWLPAPFDDDPAKFHSELAALRVVDAMPEVHEFTLSAMIDILNMTNWHVGAAKSIVLFTDAPIYSPSPFYGATYEDVAALSREIDPVSIYPVVTSENIASAEELARVTEGKAIIEVNGESTQGVIASIVAANQPPTVILKNDAYVAQPGQEITFDASDSHVAGSAITHYEWDFDGDGIYDQTTTDPVVNYIYSTQFDGSMQVRLIAANGFSGVGTAKVTIATKSHTLTPQAPANVTATVTATKGSSSTVNLAWQPADATASSWVISMDGVVLGTVAANQTSVEVFDIDRSHDQTLSVTGMSADNVLGEAATTTVSKIVALPSVPKSPTFLDKLLRFIKAIVIYVFGERHK